MTSKRGRNIIIAAVFCMALVVGSTAKASDLFALGGDPAPVARHLGLFDQAVQWLSGAWTDLKAAFGQDEAPSPVQPTCTNPNGCGDAGPGIDPIG